MHQWDISLSSDGSRLTLVSAGTFPDAYTQEDELSSPFLKPGAVYSSIINLPNGRRWVTWVGRKSER